MRRTWPGCRATSTPLTSAWPASARSKVARILTAVVLPAPFGPSTPSTLPAVAARSTPASAVTAPNCLVKPRASNAYGGAAPIGAPPRLHQLAS